ncbi:hypothetical protein H4R18_003366 [Coemansia javaensis]|uniref:Uncharacterized protein n=1 Tax=Coemansia javaensis TaxID=2761396 RepID=A0A9W8HAL5_9FUNG|nr:hypothetical protein H4R18_003366 [Coemansia javaensis]
MKFLPALFLAAAIVVAQDIFADGGDTVADGPAAITHSNENNGQQFTNSVVSTGSKGGNKFTDLKDNTFTDSINNVGISDSNIINAHQTTISGNKGSTANGKHNHISSEDSENRRRRRRAPRF